MKIHIFYTAVMDRAGKNITVGGIQNYLIGLATALREDVDEVIIYQGADIEFDVKYNGIRIIGKKNDLDKSLKKQIKEVFYKVNNLISKEDIIIFGTDKIAFPLKDFSKTISIQHGISFDYIAYDALPKIIKKNFFGTLYKWLQCYKNAKDFLICKNVVCVDYNYVNWIRTILPRKYSENAVVIPNYAKVSSENSINEKPIETIKILFARRFEMMRGVYILIDVIKALNVKYKNIEFTVCGDGPLKKTLEKELGEFSNVTITKFGIGEAEKFNLDHHITLVPTYGSEGTSFSLLEGMAAGAVPIVSNVGGMTNIILDSYNGYILNPDSESFIEKISFLIENPTKLYEFSINSKETVRKSFNEEKWKNQWIKFIKSM
ncbi:glycosyltransferase family 4 protein [Empedobacter brevis]|uniref:glycosyltransferase family 4 protein n=1 Tax=Empedobacter brevis TaxID=247 RepID=UPI0028AE85EF|nr:glycosyltransferase family 4 protein [Empedobacter brevis]